MTPYQRKLIHDSIDVAINLGALVSVNLHPIYKGDENRIKRDGGLYFAVEVGDVKPTSGESWVDFKLDSDDGGFDATLVVFDSSDQPRPEPVSNGTSQYGTPYVHAADAGIAR